MTTINPANFAFKDADGDLGTVKSLTAADITLINNALQDIENLKLCIEDPAPTGFIGLWGEDTLPEGWLLCNGAAVSRSTYAGLFAKIGTKYGTGDGSTTFNLPDFRDRYPIGSGTNALATKIAEQLPNIKGAAIYPRGNAVNGYGNFPTGMFQASFVGQGATTQSSSVQENSWQYLYNMSWGNSIYTDNGKVYPASIALNFIIKT